MKEMIKIESIEHAVICIFEDNLLAEFEETFGEIADGESMGDHIEKHNIELSELIDFLNRYSDSKYF